MPAGSKSRAEADASAAATATGITRRVQRFDLEYRDYPRGIVALECARVRYAGSAPMDAVEFAFELRQGPPVLLDRILAVVALDAALIPARLSDAERAEVAAGLFGPPARSAPGHHLGLRSRWQDLGLAHLRALDVQLRHHEPRAWESLEPEGVHQMRVTTRRLREALRAFGQVLPRAETAALADGLRWLTGVLGTIRDLDVQLARLGRLERPGTGKPNAALAGYRRHLQKRQRRAHRALVDALGDARYQDIGRHLQALVTRALADDPTDADPTIDMAGPELLDRMLRRVMRSGRRALADCEASRLHRLRIGAKRLRYFLEYVVPVGGPEITDGIEALSRLQDILGEHQDACIALHDLQHYRGAARLSGRKRRALGRLIDAESRKVKAARAAFLKEWPAFARASRTLVLC